MDVIIPGDTAIYAIIKTWPIHHKARSTVIGYMESLDMKHPALGTGPVGMEPPLNSFVLEAFSITKKLTPVIGLKTSPGARNILFAKMMLMVMYLLENLVTDIGPAREVTRGYRGAQPCWSSTKTGSAA